jgi:tetratricopeptide (TPR) repeat protein
MNTEERIHTERLLDINHAHLRELETQQAKLGILAPSSIAVQLAEYRQKIADLEGLLSEAMPRHNLPQRDYEQFVGRQKELAEVRRLLQPYPKSRAYVITIDGIGGIGKSALALEVAYTFRDQYASLPETERFEAIVWVSAKRSYLTVDGILERRQAFRTLDDLYTAIAQVLDYPAITRARAEEQRAIVEDVLREQRTLLILDNLETIDDEDLLAFLHELPDPTKALVTTRHRIDVARPIRLTGMPHEDALSLIVQEIERKGVVLTAEQQESLWQRTGGCPLAIVWSIGLMGLGGSVESVLRRLGSGQSDIAKFCFEESVVQIRGRDAHKLLMALSLFATDASREALGVAGLGEDEFGRDVGLENLLRLSLVNKDGERFSLLPLTLGFVASEAAQHAEWKSDAIERQYQNYLQFLEEDDYKWYYDWRRHSQIARELPNIVGVIELQRALIPLKDDGDGQIVIEVTQITRATQLQRLFRTLIRVCRIRGYWAECERLCHLSIALGLRAQDHLTLGWRYYDMSRLAHYRGDLQSAKKWIDQSRDAWTKTTMGVHHADRVMGLIAISENNLIEARNYILAGLEAYRQSGRTASIAQFSSALGDLAVREGNLEAAFDYYQQAIDAHKQRDDLNNQSSGLLGLAQALQLAGQWQAAGDTYSESLQLSRECGRADVMAGAFLALASLAKENMHKQDATTYARQALDLFRRLGMRREQAEAEALLAQIAQAGDAETQ